MKKQEAIDLLKAGKIQIENDCKDRLELLKELTGWKYLEGSNMFYKLDNNMRNKPFPDLPIIKLSEIEEDEEEVWQVWNGRNWDDLKYKCRLKPKPNYGQEIQALQEKAKENGMRAVVTFEKL